MSDVASGIIDVSLTDSYVTLSKNLLREKFELSRDGCQGSSRLVKQVQSR